MNGSRTREGSCRRTAGERRLCLIEVARCLFARQGFHSTGMAQIASESKILVGQIYRDFASKEDLVAAIVEQDLATLLDGMAFRDAVAEHDEHALRVWVRMFVQGADCGSDPLYAEILAEAQRNDKIAAILQSVWDRLRGRLDTALEALAPGDARQARRMRAAEVIMTLSAGMLHRRMLPSSRVELGSAFPLHLVDAELDSVMQEEPEDAGRPRQYA